MQKDYPTTEMAVNEPTKSFRRLYVPYFRTNAVQDKQEQKSGSKAVQGKDVRTLSLQNTVLFPLCFLEK